jgi:hypothetical protein
VADEIYETIEEIFELFKKKHYGMIERRMKEHIKQCRKCKS